MAELTPASGLRIPGQFEREEAWLWRIALMFLVLLAAGLAAESWERLHNLPYHLGLVPVAVFCTVVAFSAFTYGRRKRVTEMRDLLQTFQERASLPSQEQLDQLGQLIARSQRSFKELIDSLDDIALAVSLDGTLRTVNRRASQLLGHSYSDLVGHKPDEFLEEPKQADLEAALPRFLETRRWAGVVKVRVRDNPRTLYFDCMLNAIVKGDEVVGVSILARDVTEEREKEKRFTEFFETLQEGVYFSTPEGKILEANAALVHMLRYESKEELLRLPASALNVQAGDAPVLGRSVDDRGGVRTREVTLQRKDGSAGLFEDTSRAVWDADGKIVRYEGTLVDVTDRRVMEKALRTQEEFQRSLLESFPDLILVIDLEERYKFVSSRIGDLLGFDPQELVGKKVEEAQDFSPEFLSLFRDVSSARKPFGSCEYGARHRDGRWRTMRASASPLSDASGKLSGVIVSVRDVTLEKKVEEQVIQSDRLTAMGQMIGGFAHELNNPLTSILGLSELLQDAAELSEGSRKQSAMLNQQAHRAAEIVQDLLYFARPSKPGKSTVNLADLVQRTLHLQAYALRKSNITVDLLPDPSQPQVTGDPHQLMQVFMNLVVNAEQAMREVRDRGTLRIRIGHSGNVVTVTFQDDGPGIPAEVLPHIFDPFYTTKRPGRGTGLGLSVCKAILREHGGDVEAASAPGGGAALTVMLPVTNYGQPPVQ